MFKISMYYIDIFKYWLNLRKTYYVFIRLLESNIKKNKIRKLNTITLIDFDDFLEFFFNLYVGLKKICFKYNKQLDDVKNFTAIQKMNCMIFYFI